MGPVGNQKCSSQKNTDQSSKQHSMHMAITTLQKFQKADDKKTKKKKSFGLSSLQDKPKYHEQKGECN